MAAHLPEAPGLDHGATGLQSSESVHFAHGFALKFTAGGLLGEGSHGRVYECAPTAAGLADLGRRMPPLAVKVMRISTAAQVAALEREVVVWRTLAHNGIVRLVEAFVEEGVDRQTYARIVMEKPPLVRPILPGGGHLAGPCGCASRVQRA
jgi:serine/threonine protein kinase